MSDFRTFYSGLVSTYSDLLRQQHNEYSQILETLHRKNARYQEGGSGHGKVASGLKSLRQKMFRQQEIMRRLGQFKPLVQELKKIIDRVDQIDRTMEIAEDSRIGIQVQEELDKMFGNLEKILREQTFYPLRDQLWTQQDADWEHALHIYQSLLDDLQTLRQEVQSLGTNPSLPVHVLTRIHTQLQEKISLTQTAIQGYQILISRYQEELNYYTQMERLTISPEDWTPFLIPLPDRQPPQIISTQLKIPTLSLFPQEVFGDLLEEISATYGKLKDSADRFIRDPDQDPTQIPTELKDLVIRVDQPTVFRWTQISQRGGNLSLTRLKPVEDATTGQVTGFTVQSEGESEPVLIELDGKLEAIISQNTELGILLQQFQETMSRLQETYQERKIAYQNWYLFTMYLLSIATYHLNPSRIMEYPRLLDRETLSFYQKILKDLMTRIGNQEDHAVIQTYSQNYHLVLQGLEQYMGQLLEVLEPDQVLSVELVSQSVEPTHRMIKTWTLVFIHFRELLIGYQQTSFSRISMYAKLHRPAESEGQIRYLKIAPENPHHLQVLTDRCPKNTQSDWRLPLTDIFSSSQRNQTVINKSMTLDHRIKSLQGQMMLFNPHYQKGKVTDYSLKMIQTLIYDLIGITGFSFRAFEIMGSLSSISSGRIENPVLIYYPIPDNGIKLSFDADEIQEITDLDEIQKFWSSSKWLVVDDPSQLNRVATQLPMVMESIWSHRTQSNLRGYQVLIHFDQERVPLCFLTTPLPVNPTRDYYRNYLSLGFYQNLSPDQKEWFKLIWGSLLWNPMMLALLSPRPFLEACLDLLEDSPVWTAELPDLLHLTYGETKSKKWEEEILANRHVKYGVSSGKSRGPTVEINSRTGLSSIVQDYEKEYTEITLIHDLTISEVLGSEFRMSRSTNRKYHHPVTYSSLLQLTTFETRGYHPGWQDPYKRKAKAKKSAWVDGNNNTLVTETLVAIHLMRRLLKLERQGQINRVLQATLDKLMNFSFQSSTKDREDWNSLQSDSHLEQDLFNNEIMYSFLEHLLIEVEQIPQEDSSRIIPFLSRNSAEERKEEETSQALDSIDKEAIWARNILLEMYLSSHNTSLSTSPVSYKLFPESPPGQALFEKRTIPIASNQTTTNTRDTVHLYLNAEIFSQLREHLNYQKQTSWTGKLLPLNLFQEIFGTLLQDGKYHYHDFFQVFNSNVTDCQTGLSQLESYQEVQNLISKAKRLRRPKGEDWLDDSMIDDPFLDESKLEE